MRHYEIVFLVHPDQSEQVPAMIERYSAMATAERRREFIDWKTGVVVNSPIPSPKLHKAHYVLMNIECDQSVLWMKYLRAFKFSDAVLRHLVIRRDEADYRGFIACKIRRAAIH